MKGPSRFGVTTLDQRFPYGERVRIDESADIDCGDNTHHVTTVHHQRPARPLGASRSSKEVSGSCGAAVTTWSIGMAASRTRVVPRSPGRTSWCLYEGRATITGIRTD
jgi:hypothetical protein